MRMFCLYYSVLFHTYGKINLSIISTLNSFEESVIRFEEHILTDYLQIVSC